MRGNYIVFFIIPFLTFTYTISKSQVNDTLTVEEEIVDTVIIKKEPFIIKRTVILDEKDNNSINNSGLDIFFNSGIYNNYYSSCEICKPYVDRVKSSSHPILSYGGGLGYSYFKKKFYGTVGINFNNYRERFIYSDSSGKSYNLVNSLGYIGLNLGGGIKAFSKNKIQVFITSEAGIVRLSSSKGSVVSISGKPEVISMKEAGIYNKYLYNILAGVRVNYAITDYLKIWITPYFQGDLWTVTKISHPYLQQKEVLGGRLGMFYIFHNK
jgi:hypothetical protein